MNQGTLETELKHEFVTTYQAIPEVHLLLEFLHVLVYPFRQCFHVDLVHPSRQPYQGAQVDLVRLWSLVSLQLLVLHPYRLAPDDLHGQMVHALLVGLVVP